jgi:colanic acid/amylovoran biosynthesis glycosyltransferase
MPIVIHSVNPYLEPTTVWIYDQIRSHDRYSPIVYSRNVRNLDLFPMDRVVDFGTGVAGSIDRLGTKLRGTYPRHGAHAIRDGGDLIHAHFGQEGYRCLAARRSARIPLVTTFYGLDVSVLPRMPVWKSRFERLFDEGDLFLAEGPHMASCLVSIGCPEEKVRVQPLGIDLSTFPSREWTARGEQFSILMYASLREKKGHRYGIDAFHQIAHDHPESSMQIIGDGPLRQTLEQQIEALRLKERVSFLGNLPHEICKRHLQAASVLLYPSVTASDGDTEGGAPVGILEAMAVGLPVVSTRHADIPFVTGEGTAAHLSDERDVDGLAAGLRQVLNEDEKVKRMVDAGQRAAEETHSLAAQAQSLERHYDTVLEKEKGLTPQL